MKTENFVNVGDVFEMKYLLTSDSRTLACVKDLSDGNSVAVFPQVEDAFGKEGLYRVESIKFSFDVPKRHPVIGDFCDQVTHNYCVTLSPIIH